MPPRRTGLGLLKRNVVSTLEEVYPLIRITKLDFYFMLPLTYALITELKERYFRNHLSYILARYY